MTKKQNIYRFILAGGGTGGHLYPVIAVAQQIKMLKPDSEFLFVGTKHKIEAQVVPGMGYEFKTIWISGIARKLSIKNLIFPVKFFVASIQALILNFKFKPRVAIGSGAYVAGPVIWGASVMGAKILLLEQNSYPGITNRLLEKRAEEIHIAFEESKKYFRNRKKLKVSGNPVRIDMMLKNKEEAKKSLGFEPGKKVLLVLGGSLGAGSINTAVSESVKKFTEENIRVIWQCGRNYYEEYRKYESEDVKVLPFIDDMSTAYSAADLILARAGATTIAELSYLGLPVVFVPSSNVAADHQYKNAKALADKNAAVLIRDEELKGKLGNEILYIIRSEEKLNELSKNIKKFAKPDAARTIAQSALRLAEVI